MELELISLYGLKFIAGISMIFFILLASSNNQKSWIFLVLFFSVKAVLHLYLKLPTSAGAQIFFIILAVYGWFKWNSEPENPEIIQSWPLPLHLILNALSLLILGVMMISYTKSSNPLIYLEVITAIYIIFGIYTLSHRLLGSWVYWCISFISSIVYFSRTEMYYNIVLSTIFLLFSIYAYFKWELKLKKRI